jgi:capsular polysaccharide transport system permease protein
MSLLRQYNDVAPYTARPRGFWAALKINLRIIGALMMREGSARNGHESLGFFWVMGEPLILMLGVMLMWTATGMTHGHGIGVVPFALSGYTLITLWRHISMGFSLLIRRNCGLLFHRNIRVLDILISRALLESIAILTAFFIAYVPLALFGAVSLIRDPLLLFGAWVLHTWFSSAVGLIIAALTELSEGFERFIPPTMYITLPITGAFTMQSWLPQNLREVLAWSPLVNTQEMFRGGLFPADIPTYWNAWYVVVVCVILTAIGLPLVAKAQKHVTME